MKFLNIIFFGVNLGLLSGLYAANQVTFANKTGKTLYNIYIVCDGQQIPAFYSYTLENFREITAFCNTNVSRIGFTDDYDATAIPPKKIPIDPNRDYLNVLYYYANRFEIQKSSSFPYWSPSSYPLSTRWLIKN